MSVMLLGICTGLMWLAFLGYLLVLSGNSLLRCSRRFLIEAGVSLALAAPVVSVKLLGATPLVVTASAAAMSLVGLAVIVRRVPTFKARPSSG